MKYHWRLMDFFFDLIRREFWKDYDPNEEFYCCHCCKPVFKRYIFCSDKCEKLDEIKMKKQCGE